jgi:cell division protease FtsH
LLAALALGSWLCTREAGNRVYPSVDYSVFYDWVEGGRVESVVVEGPRVQGELNEPQRDGEQRVEVFQTVRPDDDDALLPLLREQGVQIRVKSPEQSLGAQILISLLPWLLIFGLWIWVSRRAQSMMPSGGGLGGMLRSKTRKFDRAASVSVSFDDVAGHAAAKRDLAEIVQFLSEPEWFRRLGAKVPRGVLLAGPPGTGKTLLARAVAGESGVAFYSISASEFIEMFVGMGAARVRDLFGAAKKDAPAILFIDEIDAVGRARGSGLGGGHDEREQTLNQLLSEMDGFDRNDMIVVLAATNRPDVLDPALLRPGRFDRRVVLDRPELAARRAILDVHVKGKPLGDDVDLAAVARNTPGFSGADLANLVNEAALHATSRHVEQIEAEDFSQAYDKIVLGDPREAKLTSDDKRRVAVHEAGHAVVAQLSPHSEPLHRVTIIPRGMALGVTQQVPAEDRVIMTQPELEARLRVLLAGYASERLVLGDVSTGAENDLEEATKLATKMVAHYGMSERLGAMHYEHATEHPFLGQKIATDGGVSDVTTHVIEDEARRMLSFALEAATELLERERDKLVRLQRRLVEKETVEAEELRSIFEANGAGPGRRAAPASLS